MTGFPPTQMTQSLHHLHVEMQIHSIIPSLIIG